MRVVIFMLIAALAGGCRSRKEIQSVQTSLTDSVAIAAQRRSMMTVDSFAQHVDFSFDTLKITLEEPGVSITAINGRAIGRRSAVHERAETSEQRDSTAYQAASGHSLAAHSAPGRSWTSLLAILFIVTVIYIRFNHATK